MRQWRRKSSRSRAWPRMAESSLDLRRLEVELRGTRPLADPPIHHGIEQHSHEQNHAGHHLHPERIDVQQVEAVANEVDEESAGDRAADCRHTAKQARATED